MNQDLKSRIPVAILYVLVIGLLTLSGQLSTCVLLVTFFIMSLYEFVKADEQLKGRSSIFIYGLSLILTVFSLMPEATRLGLLPIIVVTCLFMIINVVYLIKYRKTLLTKPPKVLLTLLYIVSPFIIAMSMTVRIDLFPKVLLGTFIILWLNDAGAYFVGKAIGKHKLFPSVSPGKTWEGLIGGGIAGFLISLLLPSVLGVLDLQTWLLLTAIIWISGSYGDLVESSWKRNLGIKDSSHLMRGHGGFLDRLDSFIYAVPFVSIYILAFGVS